MGHAYRRIGSLFHNVGKKYSIFIVLIVLFLICAAINKNFLTVENLANISRQISVTTILAFGATILIIGGMIDLSCGSVLALSGLFSVYTYVQGGTLFAAVAVGLFVGVFCNSINAVLVRYFSMPPFIVTLAMLTMARGAALLFTRGQNIYQIGNFSILGQGSIGIIPIPVIIMLFIGLFTWYLLNHTVFGRSLYAVGGNEEAAKASGINTGRIKVMAYCINGIFVAAAGILFMSRVNAGLPNGAIGYEFEAITAAIIGGTSFSGGIGTAAGTFAGAFIVGFLNNIMNLLGVNSYLQQTIKGAIIALAVMYDIYAKNKRTTRKTITTQNKP